MDVSVGGPGAFEQRCTRFQPSERNQVSPFEYPDYNVANRKPPETDATDENGAGKCPDRTVGGSVASRQVAMIQMDPTSGLLSSVLVLNRYYSAVHVVNVRRAFGLLCRQLAEVLDIEDGHYANYDFASWLEISELRAEEKRPEDDWVRSVSFEIQVPRVIRLLRYDRVPKHSLRFNRRNVFARDGHQCQYCGRTPPTQQLSMDHVLPRSRGGETNWENVVCCCLKCNSRKGGRTPQEARMSLLTKPRRPAFSPLLVHKLRNPKYVTWHAFLANSSPSLDVA